MEYLANCRKSDWKSQLIIFNVLMQASVLPGTSFTLTMEDCDRLYAIYKPQLLYRQDKILMQSGMRNCFPSDNIFSNCLM